MPDDLLRLFDKDINVVLVCVHELRIDVTELQEDCFAIFFEPTVQLPVRLNAAAVISSLGTKTLTRELVAHLDRLRQDAEESETIRGVALCLYTCFNSGLQEGLEADAARCKSRKADSRCFLEPGHVGDHEGFDLDSRCYINWPTGI